jgi:hypothetical protein
MVILDSARGYFGSDSDILLLIKILSKRAQYQGRVGSSIFANLRLFDFYRQEKDLLKYEVSMPAKFDAIFQKCVKPFAYTINQILTDLQRERFII